jgi:putative membrane protein
VAGLEGSALVLAAAALALFRFSHGFVRLRRRGRTDHAAWDRAVLFAAGVALATLPLLTRLDESSLAGHMLEHVLIADVAVVLLLLAVRGPLLFFVLPAAPARSVARSPVLGRVASRLSRPWLALLVWACVYASWHVPAAFDLARTNGAVHAAQHASFVAAGALVWMQLVDPAGRRALSIGERLAFAGALFGLGQVLGMLLLVAPEPLFPSYAAGAGALADQQLAGVVMMIEQLLTLGACAVLLVRSSMRAQLRGPSPAHA